MMAYEVTKFDVIVWLQGEQDKWDGKFTEAVDNGNDNAIIDAEEKIKQIEDLIYSIREL